MGSVMNLNWITKFNDKELHAPFGIAKDFDYYDDLRKRLTHLVNNLKTAGADYESIRIAKKYADNVCQSLRDYYRGDISSCHQRIENLIKGCDNHKLAVSTIRERCAFPGVKGTEIQFFRARKETSAVTLRPKDMLHIPFSLRGKSGNYRFSIPGVTSLYLALIQSVFEVVKDFQLICLCCFNYTVENRTCLGTLL